MQFRFAIDTCRLRAFYFSVRDAGLLFQWPSYIRRGPAGICQHGQLRSASLASSTGLNVNKAISERSLVYETSNAKLMTPEVPELNSHFIPPVTNLASKIYQMNCSDPMPHISSAL
jgi:hypothetical protein